MKSEFRPTSPADAPAVSAFLQRVFGMEPGHPTISPPCMQWKFWDEYPGYPGSRGYVMIHDGNIVAHGCVVPLQYQCGGRRVKMVQLIDWAAEPKSVGSGVTLLKRIGQTADAVIVAGGSEMTQKILPALGFSTCGQVTRYALPLRPMLQLSGGEKPVWKTAAKFLRSLLWSWQTPSGRTPGWDVRRIAPEELVSTAVRWPKPAGDMAILERSAETMRYYLACPAARMEFYTVTKEGSPGGYFVLAYLPGQARLVDFWTDSADAQDWRVLVQAAVNHARQDRSVAEIVSMSNDARTGRSLLDSGFHARGTVPLRMLASKGCEVSDAPLRIQMLDGDAAYLHSGHRDLWI